MPATFKSRKIMIVDIMEGRVILKSRAAFPAPSISAASYSVVSIEHREAI
jgi:hypothetical protein